MRKLIQYVLNGALNTVITYGLYLLLVHYIDYRIAIVIVYAVGICLLYFLHGAFVFDARGHLGLFAGVYVGLMLVNMLITWSLVEGLQWSKEIAQLPAIVVAFVLGFVINKRFVFSGAGR